MKTKVREIREEMKLSQEKLAEKSGVSRTVISDLENGKPMNITVGTMARLSGALGKEISEIFFLK